MRPTRALLLGLTVLLGLATPAAASNPPTCPPALEALSVDGRAVSFGKPLCTDPDGGAVSVAILQPAAHGGLSGPDRSGMFWYTPDDGFFGADTAGILVTDSAGDFTQVRVTLLVRRSGRALRSRPAPVKRPSNRAGRGGGGGDDGGLCSPRRSGEQCGPGNGRITAGGGGTGKVTHEGWPAVTGILWKVTSGGRGRHQKMGGSDNDELLGHHGDDTIYGGAGNDILWGDWDPKNNNTGQRDVLRGGAGNDWIYSSHGFNDIDGGPGSDHIWAYYGHGTIDCGAGDHDVVRIPLNSSFSVHNCETIGHFCSFGPDGHGGCLKPGTTRGAARRR